MLAYVVELVPRVGLECDDVVTDAARVEIGVATRVVVTPVERLQRQQFLPQFADVVVAGTSIFTSTRRRSLQSAAARHGPALSRTSNAV